MHDITSIIRRLWSRKAHLVVSEVTTVWWDINVRCISSAGKLLIMLHEFNNN